jgi:hypothetical protein
VNLLADPTLSGLCHSSVVLKLRNIPTPNVYRSSEIRIFIMSKNVQYPEVHILTFVMKIVI